MNLARPLVVFIVGPTATGKSELALELAKKIGGEIINTDSIQVYEKVEVGTAKPPKSYFEQIPHHLFGFVGEGQTCTAGDFRKAALGKIEERKQAANDLFFAAGGSGFYIQALEKGMYPVPEIPFSVKEEIEKDFSARGLSALYAELKKRDPEFASGISENDTYRIMRALEINRHLQTTGGHQGASTWTAIRKEFEATQFSLRPFDVLKIGVIRPRDEIRGSVEQRTLRMLASGWKEEVEDFRARGLGGWAPLLSVGYREIQGHLDGRLTGEDLPRLITTSTMQLVKRQTTWFRKDPEIRWYDPNDGWEKPVSEISALINARKG